MPRGGILASLERVESGSDNQLVEVVENESVEDGDLETEAVEAEATPTIPEASTPSLEDRLRQFGINEALPDSRDEAIELVLARSDDRVRGFQSNITQAAQDLARERQLFGAEIQEYRALKSDPTYQKFLQMKEAGTLPTEELDLESLPTEPLERFTALSKYAVRDLEAQVESLTRQLEMREAQTNWEQFKASNPDAEDLLQGIADNMAAGMPLEKAYKAAKAENFDPEAERQRIAAEVRAQMGLDNKKKAAAVATHSGKTDPLDIPPEEYAKMSRREKLYHSLLKAEKEVLKKPL